MKNPYFELHKEFRAAGAELLVSSGQACVLYGIATFSKDGDWIIRETEVSCRAVLGVLAAHRATYRMGAPLDVRWLSQGWTSHFEFMSDEGIRVRTDFVSRPPRIDDVKNVWKNAIIRDGIDMVNLESLVRLKQTRRERDYNVIGALAMVCGFNEGNARIALEYLQDYEQLAKAVSRWPENARACSRPAVSLIVNGAVRRDVVAALAIEKDELVESDSRRIDGIRSQSRRYMRTFINLTHSWKQRSTSLPGQHAELVQAASVALRHE